MLDGAKVQFLTTAIHYTASVVRQWAGSWELAETTDTTTLAL